MKYDYTSEMSVEKALDQADDSVDPRVQVELERLNSATDEINKLEVDLDEARNQFRQLLTESTVRINSCSKKLGNCIEKARPYYDARIKAKEALQETQKAAVNFERANSAHAAAKEMVYLAEEGLKTEGRTFDHAWQEMLNHATMRVNESESERTRSEAEHKRASQNYQRAEVRVQRLQKELKKAISKSRPYFELKIHYNQLLEQQKVRVKNLEKQVSNVKVCYADTLKNLEHISDEIHKTRQKSLNLNGRKEFGSGETKSAADSLPESEVPPAVLVANNNSSNYPNGCSCAKDAKNFQSDVNSENPHLETGKSNEVYETPKMLTPLSETSTTKYTSYTSASSQPDTDMWSENSDTGNPGKGNAENGVDSSIASPNSENDSSITEPPDAESEDEFYKFPERWNSIHRPPPDLREIEEEIKSRAATKTSSHVYDSQRKSSNFFEGVGICSFPAETELNLNFDEDEDEDEEDVEDEGGTRARVGNNDDGSNIWTEIKLHSPEDEPFPTIKKSRAVKNELEEDYDIPYSPLSEMEPEFGSASGGETDATEPAPVARDAAQKAKINSSTLNNWINRTPWKAGDAVGGDDGNDNAKSLKGTPRKMNIRRQSLDVLWNNATGEKMKEIFSQSILKLSIGSLSERRSSESKAGEDSDGYQTEGVADGVKGNDGSSYESNLTSQFGLQFFTKKKAEEGGGGQPPSEDKKPHSPQHSLSNQIGGFITRKEKFFAKKVPSPLEKTLGYLNQDEDSNSDTESLASTDMLTDEQLASLVLDRDLTEMYQDILS